MARILSKSFILIMIGVSAAAGQRNAVPLYEESPPVSFEALNLISGTPGRSRLDISFRVSYDFFVFVRNSSTDPPFPFVSSSDITVEIVDGNRVSVARELLRKDIGLPELPPQSAPSRFLEGIFSFDLPPGEYSIVFEIDDRESERHFLDKSRTITLRDFSGDSLHLSDVVFTQSSPQQPESVLVPITMGGNVPFGSDFDGYLEISGASQSESLSATYTLSKIGPETAVLQSIATIALDANSLTTGSIITPVRRDRYYEYAVSESADTHKRTAWMHFRGDTLDQGQYELAVTVRIGKSSAGMKRRFGIRWVGMPVSLRSLDRATEALEYIAPKEDFSQIRSGDAKNRRSLFEKFWKQRDPTPRTAYNEVMAEYYKRVDYAYLNFASLRVPNGVKTDRGKTYILFGPPAKVERDLLPSSPPREGWLYPAMKKKFVFIDEHRSGDYTLASTEEL